MLDLDKMQVLLTVTTDAGGVVRRAVVAPEDVGRVGGNMRLRVFSERAVRAVLDPELRQPAAAAQPCWGRCASSHSGSDRETTHLKEGS